MRLRRGAGHLYDRDLATREARHARRPDSRRQPDRRDRRARTTGRRADVGIRGDRIVALGDVREQARTTIDAGGRVVCPGFVDVHTHYDAQVFWDGTCSPPPSTGGTTTDGG